MIFHGVIYYHRRMSIVYFLPQTREYITHIHPTLATTPIPSERSPLASENAISARDFTQLRHGSRSLAATLHWNFRTMPYCLQTILNNSRYENGIEVDSFFQIRILFMFTGSCASLTVRTTKLCVIFNFLKRRIVAISHRSTLIFSTECHPSPRSLTHPVLFLSHKNKTGIFAKLSYVTRRLCVYTCCFWFKSQCIYCKYYHTHARTSHTF